MTSLTQVADRLADDQTENTERDGDAYVVALRHEAWIVGYRLVRADGEALWSITEHFVRYTGSGGATLEEIRRLPNGRLLAQARYLANQRALSGEMARAQGLPGNLRPYLEGLEPFLAESPRGARRTDADYAALALRYSMRISDGDRSPAKSFEAEYGGSARLWANRFLEARKRGLLTPATQGKPGGSLTAKAEVLLFGDNPDLY